MNAVARAISAPATVMLKGWALLAMDGLTLALPQKDIVTIELTTVLQPAEHGGSEVGWLEQNEQRWPIYGIDQHCALVPTLAESARVCMLFRSEQRILGLAGMKVTLLAADADLSTSPLPACLTRPGSPLVGLALRGEVIVAIAHAQALTDYLVSLEVVHGD